MSSPDLRAPAGRQAKPLPQEPSCPTSELAVIGCSLWDQSLAPSLNPEWFFDLRHRHIAETIIAMAFERKPIDSATVQIKLPREFGQLVSMAVELCHSPAGFPYWRDILNEKMALRKIIRATATAQASAMESAADLSEILASLDRAKLESPVACQESDFVDVKVSLGELRAEYEANISNGKPRGIMTGFHDLDRLTGGLKPQQLFVIAARPSVGKTSLALNIAEHIALVESSPVCFFSLEMSGKELLHRMACSFGRVDSSALSEGKPSELDVTRLIAAHGRIQRAQIHICEKGGLSVIHLSSIARKIAQRTSAKVFFIDYLGLVRSGEQGRSRYEETTLVSNSLKALAKELNAPVIALAQLNRENDKEGRAPRLSDLRDSGAIEQDADIVATLHKEDDEPGDIQQVTLTVLKNRSGRTGKARLEFFRNYTRFETASPIEK